jgi:DNA-binding MarR family transcriptional regulator
MRRQAMSPKSEQRKQTTCDAAHRVLSPEKREAWSGFIRAHSVVTKALDADLIANFGLQLSAFEVLAKLEGAEDGYMRMSDLAQEVLLSQSRISRLCTELESRGLLERKSCSSDSRVVHVQLTESGQELLNRVVERHFEGVDQHFFGDLDEREVKQLAALWPRVIEAATTPRKAR